MYDIFIVAQTQLEFLRRILIKCLTHIILGIYICSI